MPPVRELLSYSTLIIVSVFCLVNPFRSAFVFASLTQPASDDAKRRLARAAVGKATLVLLAVAWVTNVLVQLAYIHTGGVRIAASVAVFVFAVRGLLAADASAPEAPTGTDLATHVDRELTRAVFTAGPLMGTVGIYAGEVAETWRKLAAVGSIAIVMGLTWWALRRADGLSRALGTNGVLWLTRMCLLLSAAWATDFTFIGVRDLMPILTTTAPAQ